VLEFNNRSVRPKGVLNFLPCHKVTGALKEHGENSERLLCEVNRFIARTTEFTGTEVKLETVETGYAPGMPNIRQKTPR
jgi:hypothetical protein